MKLQMALDPSARHPSLELRIEPPYKPLAAFLLVEIMHSPSGCEEWIDALRRVRDGEPMEGQGGNSYFVDADAAVARFRSYEGDVPVELFSVPTPILLEALERWLAYLLEQGYKRSELDPRQFG